MNIADLLDGLRTASATISLLDDQISQMEGMFSDDDGQIAEARSEAEEALAAIEALLTKPAATPEVIVEIEGGIVQAVYGVGLPKGATFTTLDYDTEGADEDELGRVNGEPVYIGGGGEVEEWTGVIEVSA